MTTIFDKTKKFRIQRRKDWSLVNIQDVWRYKDLLVILISRDIKLRYKQTFLGVVWVILQPLLSSIILAIIFGNFAELPSDDIPYIIFAFTGLIPWSIFSQSVQRASQSLIKDSALITKVYFPRVLLPIAATLSTVIDFLISFLVLLTILAISKVPISSNLILIPGILLLCYLTAIGVGFWISSFSVYYRDFIYTLPFIIQIWMYCSPILYSTELIPKKWIILYSLNPMVGIINSFRWALIGNNPFPIYSLTIGFLVSTIIFITGLLVFNKLEINFSDII